MAKHRELEVSERGMSLRRFTERRLSWDTMEMLVQGFHEGMTDEERDSLAAQINRIIDDSTTEEEMIKKVKEL